MSFTRKTILVVDGNKTLVLYMGIMLKRMGFNVVPADSGHEALKLVRLVTPDLIILDSFHPSSDGYETLKKIRSDSYARDVPVIITVSELGDDFKRQCEEAGCNGFLPKPIPMDMLHDYIQEFIFAPLGFRRKHLRVQATIKVMLFKGDTAREYHTETVSEGGAYLKADSPLPVGTEVGISIRHNTGILEIRGRVIYIKGAFEAKSGIPTGMAVEFADLTPRDSLVLNRLVTGLIAADVAEADGRPVMTMPWQSGSAGRLSAEDQS